MISTHLSIEFIITGYCIIWSSLVLVIWVSQDDHTSIISTVRSYANSHNAITKKLGKLLYTVFEQNNFLPEIVGNRVDLDVVMEFR